MPQAGQTLGSYHLVRLLHHSVYAEVFLGEYVSRPGLQVAVKVFSAIHLPAGAQLAFQQEAEDIKKCNHPHLHPLLDFGIDGDIPYLVTEYIPQGTLRQLHAEGTLLPISMILSYSKTLASILQDLHDHALVHGNLKPQNILLDAQNNLVLTDSALDSLEPQVQAVSDLGDYLALEAIQGQPVAASDQYALAVMIYEWLCGQRPFTGNPALVAKKQIQDVPEPLRHKVAGLNSTFEHQIIRALSRDAGRRHTSIQEFVHLLEEAYAQATGPTLLAGAGQTLHSAPTIANRAPPTISPLPSRRSWKWLASLRTFLAFDTRVLNLRRIHTRSGRYLVTGVVGDLLSALLMGVLLQSWWVWLWVQIISLYFRILCAGLLRREVALLLAVLLALYRAVVWGYAERSLMQATHFGWHPPWGVVAILVCIISLILNVRFARKK